MQTQCGSHGVLVQVQLCILQQAPVRRGTQVSIRLSSTIVTQACKGEPISHDGKVDEDLKTIFLLLLTILFKEGLFIKYILTIR